MLIRLTLAWMAGIVLAEWLEPPWAIPGILVVLGLALLLLWYRRPLPRRLSMLVLVAALGTLRAALAQPHFGPSDVVYYAGEAVDLRGMVAGESEARSQGVSFPLQVEALRLEGAGWIAARGTVLVQGNRFLHTAYGDRLHLSGMLQRPLSGGQSSYRDDLARQGIYVLLKRAELVEVLAGRGGFLPARILHDLRAWGRGRLEAMLPEPSASLLVGILLGSRASIPPDVQEAFSRSGTTHILAISGWNINIVAAFLAALTRRLSRRVSFLLVLGVIVLYTLLVGAGAAVLRAALMGTLYIVAQQVGRPGHGLTALFATAWVMTAWNPGTLWDIGFQLSFAATLGMLLFVPIWTAVWARWPQFLSESLAATLASQLLTWPLMAVYFQQFSLIVPLSNLLACPALSPLMLFGVLTLFAGSMPGLGWLLRGLTWLLAAYMLSVVGWTGRIPWASVPLPALGPALLVLYYGGIGLWWWRWKSAADPAEDGVQQSV